MAISLITERMGTAELKPSEIFRINLRHLRRDKKLSLEMLAESSGVSRAMLNQIETGRSNPTIDLAARIAAGLDKSLSELLTPLEAPGQKSSGA
ncbi:MAG: helix-turn-helix transcriptional regulator [Hyphomicrobium sp.]|uniref:helix-turn-helix domain-containing protein n=1 Tax=Hyphomicrobium sp. TaxID=82 RepID=UPI0039E4571E